MAPGVALYKEHNYYGVVCYDDQFILPKLKFSVLCAVYIVLYYIFFNL